LEEGRFQINVPEHDIAQYRPNLVLKHPERLGLLIPKSSCNLHS
jgi:hypothetical protein